MSIMSIIVLGCLYVCVFLVIVVSLSGYLKRVQKPLIFFGVTSIILILTYNSILVFAHGTDGGEVTATGPISDYFIIGLSYIHSWRLSHSDFFSGAHS